jgi:hypothetical protein
VSESLTCARGRHTWDMHPSPFPVAVSSIPHPPPFIGLAQETGAHTLPSAAHLGTQNSYALDTCKAETQLSLRSKIKSPCRSGVTSRSHTGAAECAGYRGSTPLRVDGPRGLRPGRQCLPKVPESGPTGHGTGRGELQARPDSAPSPKQVSLDPTRGLKPKAGFLPFPVTGEAGVGCCRGLLCVAVTKKR